LYTSFFLSVVDEKDGCQYISKYSELLNRIYMPENKKTKKSQSPRRRTGMAIVPTKETAGKRLATYTTSVRSPAKKRVTALATVGKKKKR